MIVFKSVSWKNFLSTGNSPNKVLLNKSNTTLIVGRNGEGKSTILDALCFSLFGKPFRDINKGQLVNSINQKNCLVEIEFSIGATEYRVIRGIKPNIFEIYQNNVLLNQDSASRDYQKILEQQILHLNYKTFTQVVILGSASFVPFMQLPSNQRREVIEDILDIRIFSTMNGILKDRMVLTKEQISRAESAITVCRNSVGAQQKIIENLLVSKQEHLTSIKNRIADNDAEIETNSTKINELVLEITALSDSIADKKDVVANIRSGEILHRKKVNKKQETQETINFFTDYNTCPSCEQGIPHAHKETILEKLTREHNLTDTEVSQLTDALDKLNARMSEIEEINTKITDLNAEVASLNTSITTLNSQNKKMQAEMETTKQDTGNIDEEKRKLKELAAEAMKKIDEKTALLDEKGLQDIASTLLKDSGIKTAIIREYLPAMNKLINKYLTAMDFYVHFELDEGFNEKIKSRYRDEFTYASFSEGEKMRIDLAILFTWRQIAKMKNSVNTNLLILDEIFDSSLDTAGTDYFLTVMNQFEKSNVFVISHKGDQLFDKFRSIIKFEKKNDFSVIAKN